LASSSKALTWKSHSERSSPCHSERSEESEDFSLRSK